FASMLRIFFIPWFACLMLQAFAQPAIYSTANAHSHNDYEQSNPFYEAWNNGFGSIEADIFLQNNKLLVAHTTGELNDNRTLQSLYLDPLRKAVEMNHGYPYADSTKALQLLVDVKTDSVKTLDKLIEILNSYPSIISCSKIKIAISGNRPSPEAFGGYPSYIYFDGVLNESYSSRALSKIIMLSDNFRHYSTWQGTGSIAVKDYELLKQTIDKAHQLKKKVRFWNAPDNPDAWRILEGLHADYINTDHIAALANFLNRNINNRAPENLSYLLPQ
ncbi:MAG TPA: phosphatidylinositol-specific phospholipase C/glycerophosphodiester phosphodiesterase family protein, partial [Chitinophagaceae bacterium]|nr:phosphatidylinositol-specific phospholipase C/glycerophosphodiester phosphodiesterase family protein [Chitinophagaceae bacterium]